ncbi:MAG: hypothetical protein DA408_16675 [Bacteroidetes bacterium]|nr:MAG: hypothetical protein C7N36_07055 [Bacteroidota bacterium]PTM10136.1 MAG: hypothetical protein DA408_16675 [Bacteroidota bacterium]
MLAKGSHRRPIQNQTQQEVLPQPIFRVAQLDQNEWHRLTGIHNMAGSKPLKQNGIFFAPN